MTTVGLCGLGGGELLAGRFAARGVEVAVWDPAAEIVDAFVAKPRPGRPFTACRAPAELAAVLARPRIVIVATDGAAADERIRALVPHLEPGDVLAHAANEHYETSRRRAAEIATSGIRFVDLGVGIGPEAARHGPSIAAGGDAGDYAQLRSVLEAIAAPLDDGPCVARVGPVGAGHFTKMMQMGIEYADMQLLAEGYDLLRTLGGFSNDELADTFDAWDRGELGSLFVSVTGPIFRTRDEPTDERLVDAIADVSGMKPPGKWIARAAVELGVPMPAVANAVDVRLISALPERPAVARALGEPIATRELALRDEVQKAIYAAKICAYAQAFALLSAAATAHHWQLDRAAIARLGRAGCTVRGALFERVQRAYERDPTTAHLLLDPELAAALRECVPAWRHVVALAVTHGLGVPALASSLAIFDTLRRARLPLNLILAQRDLVGGIPYQRIDRDGSFHADWTVTSRA
jgi:6-phosphogluconate dehydrogenase